MSKKIEFQDKLDRDNSNWIRLVKYLGENYPLGGGAFNIVLTEKILKESDFSVEELHEMILGAKEFGYVEFARHSIRGNRWGVDSWIPGDIDSVSLTREGMNYWRNNLCSP
jgi:hypothetical protein